MPTATTQRVEVNTLSTVNHQFEERLKDSISQRRQNSADKQEAARTGSRMGCGKDLANEFRHCFDHRDDIGHEGQQALVRIGSGGSRLYVAACIAGLVPSARGSAQVGVPDSERDQ